MSNPINDRMAKPVPGLHCFRINKQRALIVVEKTWFYKGWKHIYKYIPMMEAPDL